jgi:thioredoxin-like negative regulator of GroEL
MRALKAAAIAGWSWAALLAVVLRAGAGEAFLTLAPAPCRPSGRVSLRMSSSDSAGVNLVEITSLANLEDMVAAQDERPMMVIVTASWCKACKKVLPAVMDVLAEHPEVRCGRVDMSELGGNRDIKAHLGIRGVPMCIVYKENRRVDHFTGTDQESLMEFISDNLLS